MGELDDGFFPDALTIFDCVVADFLETFSGSGTGLLKRRTCWRLAPADI